MGVGNTAQAFHFISLITTKMCNFIIDGDNGDNKEDDVDDDKGEYMYVKFKFEKMKVILQNAQSTYLAHYTSRLA